MNQRLINQRYSGCSEWIFFFSGLRNIKHVNALSLRANNKTSKIELACIWDVLTHLNLLKHIHLTKCFWLEKMCSHSGSVLSTPCTRQDHCWHDIRGGLMGLGTAGSSRTVLKCHVQAQIISLSLGQTGNPVTNPSMAEQPYQAASALFT